MPERGLDGVAEGCGVEIGAVLYNDTELVERNVNCCSSRSASEIGAAESGGDVHPRGDHADASK